MNHEGEKQPRIRATDFILSVAFLLPLTLSGCNTISGAGEDVEAAGKAIEKAAETNKQY